MFWMNPARSAIIEMMHRFHGRDRSLWSTFDRVVLVFLCVWQFEWSPTRKAFLCPLFSIAHVKWHSAVTQLAYEYGWHFYLIPVRFDEGCIPWLFAWHPVIVIDEWEWNYYFKEDVWWLNSRGRGQWPVRVRTRAWFRWRHKKSA